MDTIVTINDLLLNAINKRMLVARKKGSLISENKIEFKTIEITPSKKYVSLFNPDTEKTEWYSVDSFMTAESVNDKLSGDGYVILEIF